MNYKQIKAIEKNNKKKLLKYYPNLNEHSGIYILTRKDDVFKFAYIGQAKHILTRLAQHLKGYQHIDISLRKYGIYSDDNTSGWRIKFIECNEDELNNKEQELIKEYAYNGYQLYNHTTGSQGKGKKALGEQKQRKGYNQGLHNGYERARKDIAKLFNNNLTYSIKGKPNKNKEKALKKFNDFISGG